MPAALETSLALLLFVAAALLALAVARPRSHALWLLGAGAALCALFAVGRTWEPAPVSPALPGRSPREDMVSSGACRSCHPDQYSSWFASYHRTMTQQATPGTVLGAFDGRELQGPAGRYRVGQSDDEVWAKQLEPPPNRGQPAP